jgi:hypothetical protein
MAANGTATKATEKSADRNVTETAVAYVRQTSERAVDIPVGAVLTARDRVNGTFEPWTKPETRTRELKGLRTQVTRELNKLERRGGQARRKTTQRVRQARKRFERRVIQRRRSVSTSLKQNRTKVEGRLKKAQTSVQDRVTSLV